MSLPVELHVASIDDLDLVWRLLRSQDVISEALLCVKERGPIWRASRCDDGRWTAHFAGPQGCSSPLEGLEAFQS